MKGPVPIFGIRGKPKIYRGRGRDRGARRDEHGGRMGNGEIYCVDRGVPSCFNYRGRVACHAVCARFGLSLFVRPFPFFVSFFSASFSLFSVLFLVLVLQRAGEIKGARLNLNAVPRLMIRFHPDGNTDFEWFLGCYHFALYRSRLRADNVRFVLSGAKSLRHERLSV